VLSRYADPETVVTTTATNSPVFDEAALDDDLLAEELPEDALEAAGTDDWDVAEGAVAEVADRDLEDFDFVAVVAGLPTVDVPAALAELARYRGPYQRAARRAGRRSPEADFYNAVNGPLFNRRTAVRDRVGELEAVPEQDRDGAHRVALRRARLELEMLTELIVRFNYGMTRKYVRLFTSNTSREDSEDFQGAALLGLMTSIDTFDPAKGKFGSWAYKRIQREVLRAVRDADYKSMNHGDFERRPDILREYNRLAGPNEERTPSFEEVAAAVGCTVDLVRRVLAAPRLDSLHAAVGADGETELGELLADPSVSVDEQVLTSMDVAALVEHGLSVLEPREHYVLARRFGLDGEPVQCLSSIGKQLRLSREAVRQIEAKGLARLLHPSTLSMIVRHGRPAPAVSARRA
jgi:RNA polymerase primary sigma factor/RNA polymerase nonessential primary-like sigma factor